MMRIFLELLDLRCCDVHDAVSTVQPKIAVARVHDSRDPSERCSRHALNRIEACTTEACQTQFTPDPDLPTDLNHGHDVANLKAIACLIDPHFTAVHLRDTVVRVTQPYTFL